MKVTSLEARIADLECKNQELLDIIGPFKNQLMQFELERNFLLSKTENTEKELKALSLEHAKSLGHQNHKQKIKHVVNLHETIANLKKVSNSSTFYNCYSLSEFLHEIYFLCILLCRI